MAMIPATCSHTHAKPAEPHPDALCTAFQPIPESVITLRSINSGIVVLEPSDELSAKVINGLHTDPEVTRYGFPDQDFLSSHFKNKNKNKFLGHEYKGGGGMNGEDSRLK